MPKTLRNALNPKTVASLSRPGKYADGGGLALRIDQSGNKRWVQRLTLDGKETMRGLGTYPEVSLAQARQVAAVNLEKSKVQRAAAAAAESAVQTPESDPVLTFWTAASRYIDANRPTWSSEKHANQWRNTLWAYAHPVIGDKPVDQIASADVMDILEPMWLEKRETASRVRQRIEAVLDWCHAHGYRPADNPAGRHLLKVLPKAKKLKEHHRALPYQDVAMALKKMRQSTAYPLTKFAFEFMVLTAARSGEVRLADWLEIDWEQGTWTVPAEHMKARREHRVPLSDRAVVVLGDAWELSGGEGLVFPAPKGGAMSDMTFTGLLRRLKVDAVPHGFRSSFRDWAAEKSGAPWAVCESALAHTVGNSVEASYMRSDLLDQRRGLMQQWADYCAG